MRRKGQFTKRGYAGRVQALRDAARKKHEEYEERCRTDHRQEDGADENESIESFKFSGRYVVDMDLLLNALT